MIAQPEVTAVDCTPDHDGLLAMRAALRDLKVVMRKLAEHPQRAEMLDMLADARVRTDLINQPTT
jgi:predicted component of type VI protein secretion system